MPPASLAAVDGISSVDKDTLALFYAMCVNMGIHPDWLSAVISFESGWNPAQPNLAGSGAMGLIQFMPAVAKELGTTTKKLSKMSVREQLRYVQAYFVKKSCPGKMKTLAGVYAGVIGAGPGCVNATTPDDAPIYRKGSDNYKANANLDKGPDGKPKGWLDKRDLARAAQGKLDAAASRPRIALDTIPPWVPPPVPPTPRPPVLAKSNDGAIMFFLAVAVGYCGIEFWKESGLHDRWLKPRLRSLGLSTPRR